MATATGAGWTRRPSRHPPAKRGRHRVTAERAWVAARPDAAVDLLRLAGIYGPGRSVFNDLREGRARRVDKPGHQFGRIHRDDITGAPACRDRAGPPAGPTRAERGGRRTRCQRRCHRGGREPAGDGRAAADPVRRGAPRDEPDGAIVLVRRPQGAERDDAGLVGPALALPDVSRGTAGDPRRRGRASPSPVLNGERPG